MIIQIRIRKKLLENILNMKGISKTFINDDRLNIVYKSIAGCLKTDKKEKKISSEEANRQDCQQKFCSNYQFQH